MRRSRVWLLAGGVLASLLPLGGAVAAVQDASPAASPAGAADEARLYEAVRPEQRDETAAETADRLERYRIEAILTVDGAADLGEGGARLEGTLALRFVNDTGAEQEALYLRLYPNDPRYGDGSLDLSDVTVDGAAVAVELTEDATVARLELPTPLAPEETAEVALAFATRVAQTFDFTSSRFNVEPVSGTISLVHWYPILAGYDPESGWLLDPLNVYGDLVFANRSLYDVALTAPTELAVAASGVQVAETEAGEGVLRREYVTGPARQFVVVADDDFVTASRDVEGTTITSFFNPGHEAAGERMLDDATRALTRFNELFGPYPYAELDLVEMPLFAIAGPEFPQLIGFDTALYDDPEFLVELGLTERLVEFIVAQGVASQWWSELVGTNHYRHAFLDEGVSEYAAALYVEREYGEAEMERVLDLADRTIYAYAYLTSGDQVVDQPTADFPDGGSFFGTVYGKGALAFHALREEIGDEAFVAALRDYAARERFTIARPTDLRGAFERAAERDLGDFWTLWFESAETRVSILVETGPAAGATPTP